MPDIRTWSAEEFAALLAKPTSLMTGDAICWALGQVAADEAELFLIVTDPDHRRQGRAMATLAGFEAAARDRGVKSVFLEVAEDNRAARALYAAAGYAERNRRPGYYRRPSGGQVAALVLEKPL